MTSGSVGVVARQYPNPARTDSINSGATNTPTIIGNAMSARMVKRISNVCVCAGSRPNILGSW